MNIRNITLIFTVAMAAGLLGSCGDSPDISVNGGDIMLSPAMEGSLRWQNSRADGDGETDPTPTTIPGTVPETIGVFAEIKETSSKIFTNQLMYNPDGEAVLSAPNIDLDDWEEGVWPYDPVKTWIPDIDYYFYCYAPYIPTNAEWVPGPTFYTFHMQRIPPISATEYAVGKYYVEGSSATGRPKLTLTHITSRLRFLFAIGEEFAKLRKIRITSIKISDSGNNSPYWECEVKLNKYLPKPTDIPLTESQLAEQLADCELDISVTKSAETYTSTEDIELIAENKLTDSSKPGQLLTKEYESFSSAYNLLGKIDFTNLTVVYDVYDTEDMIVRKDQTVTNRIDLRSFGDLERGKCYDVKIMVSPKYLYVLSDNDVDSPTAVIEPAVEPAE